MRSSVACCRALVPARSRSWGGRGMYADPSSWFDAVLHVAATYNMPDNDVSAGTASCQQGARAAQLQTCGGGVVCGDAAQLPQWPNNGPDSGPYSGRPHLVRTLAVTRLPDTARPRNVAALNANAQARHKGRCQSKSLQKAQTGLSAPTKPRKMHAACAGSPATASASPSFEAPNIHAYPKCSWLTAS